METEKRIGRQDIDYMELLYENDNISIYQLDAIHLGVNRSNMSIDEECVNVSLPSFADAPLYCVIDNQFNPLASDRNDFLEHFREEYPDRISRDRVLPFGTVPESAIPKARLVQRDNGKTYLRIQVVVWKRLLPHVSDILQRRDGSVKISVEFVIDDCTVDEKTGTVHIHKFTITAITALGAKFTEVMEGSMLKSVKFSYDNYFSDCNNSYCMFAQQKEVSVPEEVLNAIQEGIELREKYGRGGSPENYRNMCAVLNSETMLQSQVIDMTNYFSSLEETPEDGRTKTNKYILYKLFGGETCREWVNKMAVDESTKNAGSIRINNTKDGAIHSSSWVNPGKKLYDPMLEASNTKALVKEGYLIVESGYEDAPSEKLKYPHHLVRGDELRVDVAGVQAALKRAIQQGIFNDRKVYDHLKRHYSELGLDMEAFDKDVKNAVDEDEVEKNAVEDEDKDSNDDIDYKVKVKDPKHKVAKNAKEDDDDEEDDDEDEDDSEEDIDYKVKVKDPKHKVAKNAQEEDASEKCARMEKENAELCAKLAEYTRKEDMASAKMSVEKFGHCFSDTTRCELNAKVECADFDKTKFEAELCAKVMEFAAGLKDTMNAKDEEEDDKPDVVKNAFFRYQKEVQHVKDTSELSGIIKKQRTKVN